MIDPVQAAIGIVVVLITVGALLYIFYSRTNAVEKTGYGALIMLSIISLMIPVFWIMESNGETQAKIQQNNTAVAQGAALYAKYCFQCHGLNGQGGTGPALNNNSAVNSLSDTDLMRIIEAGVPKSNTDLAGTDQTMQAWSQQFGGPLSDPQIQYLFALIRSSDPAYLAKNGYPTGSGSNGFSQVPNDIKENSGIGPYATAVAQATAAAGTGQFGAPVDDTSKTAITIDLTDTSTYQSQCSPTCYSPPNVKVKVGTKITWVNKSSLPHTVTATKGTNPASEVPDPQVFDSGINTPLAPNTGTFTWTVTMAAYNANPNHIIIYYCEIHPGMLAMLTIVP
ncbi:MAG TPA: c-type cytochrome [Ktedonobacteraceae bacterium]|jgi:mono/diheme cytochrome c family protein/plastocyanin|nr:c-type cytochrome [Ktedonobacteraceae bacterium]HLI70991.1 c-type cytochrome [Ktedonobacteraceae bacterium]